MSEDWVASFERVLELAENKARARQAIIEDLRAMKISGYSRDEAGLFIAADLMSNGKLPFITVYTLFLDEVYGTEVKETTS